MDLPDCDELFLRFFDPWYTAAARARKGFSATRPDMLTDERYIHSDASHLQLFGPEIVAEIHAQVEAMREACTTDWPSYLDVVGHLDIHWIEAFDAYYDRDRVSAIIERSDPSDMANDYVVIICEFGAALGYVLQQLEPRLQWLYDHPYWESSLVDPQTGAIIPTFHWAIKKFSEYGVEDGFPAKIQKCIDVLHER